jgi:hypothetical protein
MHQLANDERKQENGAAILNLYFTETVFSHSAVQG